MRRNRAPASKPTPDPFMEGVRLRRGAWLVIALYLGGLGASGCGAPSDRPEPAGKDTVSSIADVIARHSSELMGVPGVVGVYEGETHGHRVVRIMVAKRTPELVARLPSTLEGHSVEIEETGVVRPMRGR